MSQLRTYLLINQPKFPVALKRALTERGLVIVENEFNPSIDLLKHLLGCVVGFDVGNIKHPLRAWRWRSRLSHFGVPIFSWNRDAPYYNNIPGWRLSCFARVQALDIYAAHSLIDTRWSFAGTNLFLPNAADVESYNLRGDSEETLARLRDPVQYYWDVSFFGTLLDKPHKEVVVRQAFFNALASRLDALGICYRFVDTARTPLTLEEQVALIQTSRINLNFGAYCDYCADRNYPPAGLPERCFGIPACGGFLLTDHRAHVADSFEVGFHLDTFVDLDECIRKILYYLGNFEHNRDIAEAGWRHVTQCHTYNNRAEDIHTALLEWHTHNGKA